MDRTELADVQRRHAEAGDPPCDHTRTDPDYWRNSHTGDRACLDCGDWVTPTGAVRRSPVSG